MIARSYLLLIMCVFSTSILAGPRKLINLENGKPTPEIATSWKKLDSSKYQFNLDPAVKINGDPVTPEMVKSSLERRMKKFEVKVEKVGGDAVTVQFSGDESKFLKKLAKVSIRSSKGVEIAASSSVSDGGIRAKQANRPPAENEVKAKVTKINNGMMTIVALGVGNLNSAKFKIGKKYKIALPTGTQEVEKGSTIFFKPLKNHKSVWQVEF